MFGLFKMDKANTPIIKQLPAAAATYNVGEVAVLNAGVVTKATGTTVPTYLVAEKGTKTTADTVSVIPIYKDVSPLVGYDSQLNGHNISSATLKSLLVSESAYIPESLRDRLLTSTPRQIAQEEFIDTFELGATHLALCIEQDLAQTKADLIANYSDDRRLPFVVGAIYIDAYLRYFKPFYYCFYPQDGYLRTEWKPRKIYMQPKNKLPPEKHEFKKYYKVGKSPVADIMPCPACGRPARLLRAGVRGKESQVCCTDPTEQCNWFLGHGIFNNEAEAIRIWNEMCLNRST